MYYRIYTEDGAIISKQPIYGSEDLSLGRIDIDTITPPHTITSVKLRIAKAEQLDNARNAKLFTDMSSESPMDATRVSILNSNRPGSDAAHPMVYVHLCSVQLKGTQQGACQSTFKACAKLFGSLFSAWSSYPGWLNITVGEIFNMDSGGVKTLHPCGRWSHWSRANGIDVLTVMFVLSFPGGSSYEAYTVVNSAGVSGREFKFSFLTDRYSKISFLHRPTSRLCGYVPCGLPPMSC